MELSLLSNKRQYVLSTISIHFAPAACHFSFMISSIKSSIQSCDVIMMYLYTAYNILHNDMYNGGNKLLDKRQNLGESSTS